MPADEYFENESTRSEKEIEALRDAYTKPYEELQTRIDINGEPYKGGRRFSEQFEFFQNHPLDFAKEVDEEFRRERRFLITDCE